MDEVDQLFTRMRGNVLARAMGADPNAIPYETQDGEINAAAHLGPGLVSNDGETVVINEDGITITDGALTLVDSEGSTVMTGGGFYGTWLDFLQSGLYNGNWRASPPTPASDITTGDASANRVPAWTFTQSSGTAITARWMADADSPVGGYIKLSMASGAASDRSYFEQYVSVTPSHGRAFALKGRATFDIDTLGTGGSAVAYVSLQFYKADGVTTTGSESTHSSTVSSLSTFGATTLSSGDAAMPDDAGWARIRVGLHRSAALNTATCAVRVYEVFIQRGTDVIYVPDVLNPDNTPGRITQQAGGLYVVTNDEVLLSADRVTLDGGLVMKDLDVEISASVNNFDPEAGVQCSIWFMENTAGASRNITGLGIGQGNSIDGYADVRYLFNVSSADNIVLVHQSASSDAANRFSLPGAANYTLTPGTGVMIFYSWGNSRWYVLDK